LLDNASLHTQVTNMFKVMQKDIQNAHKKTLNIDRNFQTST
jgi:hypothetical protein